MYRYLIALLLLTVRVLFEYCMVLVERDGGIYSSSIDEISFTKVLRYS
jgi:hypothetical protein